MLKIKKDYFLMFIGMLSVGGFIITLGLQYDHDIISLTGGFVFMLSYILFIPKILKNDFSKVSCDE